MADDSAAPEKGPERRRLVKRKVRAESERIACTACGAPIEVRNAQMAEMVTCGSCGSVLDLESDDKKVLRKILLDKRPFTPLPLGQKGKLKGAAWEVIGRLRLEEEGDTWEEFLLFSPVKGYAWLQLEEGHWVYIRKTKQKPPINAKLAGTGMSFRMLGKKFSVIEKSEAKIDYIEGEFTYQAQVGDRVGYMDAVNPPLMACAEWNEREMEWLIGEYIEPDTIKKGFNLKSVPRRVGVGKCQPFVWPTWRRHMTWILLAAAGILFFLIFASLVPGKRTSQFSVAASQYLQRRNAKGFLSAPIDIKSASVVQLKFQAPVDNSWVYMDGLLLDEKQDPVFTFSVNISYYHGYSGGESWSEGSRSDSTTLRIDKPGKYYLALRGEGGRGNTGTTPRNETVLVSVYEGVMLQRYFIIATLLCGVVPIFELVRRGTFEAKRTADDD